jgi:hypothetical protein
MVLGSIDVDGYRSIVWDAIQTSKNYLCQK